VTGRTSLRWGSATDAGLVRRTNQDHLVVDPGLFAVADGMGGHAAGEVASELAIDALRTAFLAIGPPRTSDDLVGAVHAANATVFEHANADAELRGMGTTLTAAAVVTVDGEERIAVANVGDSRAYVFAHGDLTQLTEDHSVAEELARIGEIGPEEVETHPQRHILTRALGIFPVIEVDLWDVLPYPGDRVLLCSDGLVREMTDEQIASVLRRFADPGEAAGELVARARSAGGADNITVVVVDVVDAHTDAGPPLPVPAAPALPAVPAAPEPRPARAHRARRGDAEGRPGSGSAPSASAPPPQTTPAPVARHRRLTARAIAFVVLLLAVLAGATVAVVAYARDSYFVTLGPAGAAAASPLVLPGSRPLVIEQGRPGGLLWFHPTLVETTGVLSSEVLPSHLADLQKGRVEPSVGAARAYVANLVQEAARAAPATTLPTAVTSTTLP